MKKKAIVTIVSVALNLILLAVLARSTTEHNRLNVCTPVTIFKIQQLPEAVTSGN
jgi:hypothetical protein